MKRYWLLLLLFAGCSAPDLIAQESTIEYVSGLLTPTYTFNGTTPGPVLHATVGESFEVTVKNTLPEPITIHWHGVRLPNDMDGVPDVTQEPILSGSTYTYSFTPQDPGVYWYHSHVEAHKQVEMGLQGMLVVDDPQLRIPSDSIHRLVLDDVAVDENGSYRSFDLNYMHGRFGNILLVNGVSNPTIQSSGNLHRFQLVNTANARTMYVSFGANPVTVYGNDIGYDQPKQVDVLEMHPGQRYDVVVEAKDDFDIRLLGRNTHRIARVNVNGLAYNTDTQTRIPQTKITVPENMYVKEPDMVLHLRGVRDAQHGLVWQINGTDSLTNPGTFTLEKGFTKIQLTNTQGQPHPMHLHGQQFVILSRDGEATNDASWKDTVMVSSQETVELAVYAQEEGNWVFHCHILEHSRAGMLATMQVSA